MVPAGGHVHKRWLDRDPCSDCDSDELYSFYDFDSEGGSGATWEVGLSQKMDIAAFTSLLKTQEHALFVK